MENGMIPAVSDSQPLLTLSRRRSRGEAVEVTTGAPVVLRAADVKSSDTSDVPKPDEIYYARCKSNGKVTLHHTLREALADPGDEAFSDAACMGVEYDASALEPVSQLDVATSLLQYVARRREARPLVDIDASWQLVTRDCVFAIIGGVPGLGWIFCGFTAYHNVWQNIHLLSPIRAPWYIKWGHKIHMMAILSVIASGSLSLGVVFILAIRDAKTQATVHRILNIVSFVILRNLCFAASVIGFMVITVSSIHVYADVAQHKEVAEHSVLTPEARKIKEALQTLFMNEWGNDEQPTHVRHPRLSVPIHTASNALIALSSVGMSAGLFLMWYAIRLTGCLLSFWVGLFPTLVGIPMTAMNWYWLLKRLLGASQLMHRNSKQFLLIRALVKDQHFSAWSQYNRDRLERVLRAARPSDGEETESLADLVEWLHVEKGLALDLRNKKDIMNWWSLRCYFEIDFMDESAIMDYCAAITLLLLLSFLSFGIFGSDGFSPDWSEFNVKDMQTFQDWVVLLAPFAGQIVLLNNIAALSIIFIRILQESVMINELLAGDTNLLLTAAQGVQVKMSAQASTDVKQWIRTRTVASVLHTLVQNVQEVDNRQMLLGFPISPQFHNAVLGALFVALLSYGWQKINPVIEELDLESVAEFVSQFVFGQKI